MMPKEMAVTVELYFPHDEIDSQNPNFDLAADYLELTAFISNQNGAAATGLIDAKEIGSEDEYNGIDEEMTDREKIVSGAVGRIDSRQCALGAAYPFALDVV